MSPPKKKKLMNIQNDFIKYFYNWLAIVREEKEWKMVYFPLPLLISDVFTHILNVVKNNTIGSIFVHKSYSSVAG